MKTARSRREISAGPAHAFAGTADVVLEYATEDDPATVERLIALARKVLARRRQHATPAKR